MGTAATRRARRSTITTSRLGYVLEKDPTALPCFDALDEPEQRAIRFTQSKMGFNHGWLVQAEAPPGALFSSFKKLIDDEGVDSADIAFYFVHWLTDLAGAVPTPLEGSTQFAVRFPQPVLASFLRRSRWSNDWPPRARRSSSRRSSSSGGRRTSWGRRRRATTPLPSCG